MVENNDDSKKYLVLSFTRSKHEIDEIFRILNTTFIEAKRLGRIPAIGKFSLSASQNLGARRNDFRFSDYLDLTRGTLRKRNQVDRVIEDNQQWVDDDRIDLNAFAEDKIYQARNQVISPQIHEQHELIIRLDPTHKYVENYYDQERPDVFLDFPCSEKVNKLTDNVLNVLGTTREEAWARQCYFLDKVTTMRSCFDEATRARGSSISLSNRLYAGLRVLSNIGKRNKESPIHQFSSTKEQIQEVLSYALRPKSKIYIMSDITDPQYFDFLKEYYEVYRYYDFPKLKELVSGENGRQVDNVMLYLVEKNIIKYAAVKILPPNQGTMMCHLNEVYNPSMLKNPPGSAVAEQ